MPLQIYSTVMQKETRVPSSSASGFISHPSLVLNCLRDYCMFYCPHWEAFSDLNLLKENNDRNCCWEIGMETTIFA